MKKQFLFVVVFAVLVMALSACGAPAPAATEAPVVATEAPATETPVVTEAVATEAPVVEAPATEAPVSIPVTGEASCYTGADLRSKYGLPSGEDVWAGNKMATKGIPYVMTGERLGQKVLLVSLKGDAPQEDFQGQIVFEATQVNSKELLCAAQEIIVETGASLIVVE